MYYLKFKATQIIYHLLNELTRIAWRKVNLQRQKNAVKELEYHCFVMSIPFTNTWRDHILKNIRKLEAMNERLIQIPWYCPILQNLNNSVREQLYEAKAQYENAA